MTNTTSTRAFIPRCAASFGSAIGAFAPAVSPFTRSAFAPAAMLVVQGTADDNVYFLNSLKLTSALWPVSLPI